MLFVFQLSSREVDQEQAPGHSSPCLLPETQQTRREPPSMGMDYLSVPPALAWGRTRASAHSPLFRLYNSTHMIIPIKVIPVRSCNQQW